MIFDRTWALTAPVKPVPFSFVDKYRSIDFTLLPRKVGRLPGVGGSAYFFAFEGITFLVGRLTFSQGGAPPQLNSLLRGFE